MTLRRSNEGAGNNAGIVDVNSHRTLDFQIGLDTVKLSVEK